MADEAAGDSNQAKVMLKTLRKWVEDETPKTAPRRLHPHFFQRPEQILGEDGKVVALRTERTRLNEDGSVSPIGEYVDHPMGAVYYAIGYLGSPLPELPFDPERGVILQEIGQSLDGLIDRIDGTLGSRATALNEALVERTRPTLSPDRLAKDPYGRR